MVSAETLTSAYFSNISLWKGAFLKLFSTGLQCDDFQKKAYPQENPWPGSMMLNGSPTADPPVMDGEEVEWRYAFR